MAERENPPGGGMWPDNGEVYERARVSSAGEAEKCEVAGNNEKAAFWRDRAGMSRKLRDRCYKEHQRRMMNRRVRRGTS